MKNWTRGLTLVGLLMASTATTQANDIVNFLKAINGNSGRRSSEMPVQTVGNHERGHEHGHDHRGSGISSGYYGANGRGPQVRESGFHRAPAHAVNLRPNRNITPPSRSGLQINLRLAANSGANQGYGSPVYRHTQPPVHVLPPVQSYPSMPVYSEVARSPFELGQFIHCHVPLATCVRVEDERNIAPNAVPVIIAIRDPNMCIHETIERLVYVQIFVPPCPLQSLHISPCRTRVSLDYGRYEVDIKSGNGIVVVDYAN